MDGRTDKQTYVSTIAKTRETLHAVARKNSQKSAQRMQETKRTKRMMLLLPWHGQNATREQRRVSHFFLWYSLKNCERDFPLLRYASSAHLLVSYVIQMDKIG